MMKIQQLMVKGFRSIKHTEIPLNDFTIFIGRNNSGKSNVLAALRFLFDGSSKNVSNEDFFSVNNNRYNEIVVQATLENVTDYLSLCDKQNRTKIESCISNDKFTIQRKALREPFSIGKIEILDTAKNEFGTPTGLDAALKPLLPEIIYIEAFKDPSSETIGKSTTILGKMLKQILSAVSSEVSIDLQNALSRAYTKFNTSEVDGIITDKRVKDIKLVEKQINKHIANVFPLSEARLSFDLPKIEDLITQSSIELFENGVWSSCERKGQGYQRVLYFALLQALAEQSRKSIIEGVCQPFILLIEEPEAFLHPQMQRQIGFTLEEISNEHQVIIASHSSSVVTPSRIPNVIVSQKVVNENNSSYSEFSPANFNGIDENDRQLIKILTSTYSSEFLFSDFVLVVEGISDKVILEAILSKKQNHKNTQKELSIVECGSKDVLKSWSEIITRFNIKTKCLADLDFLWSGAGRYLGDSPILSGFCNDFWNIADQIGIKVDGQAKLIDGKKKQAFKILNTELTEQKKQLIALLRNEKVWVLNNGEIENYIGLSSSSKSNYRKKVIEIKQNEVPIPRELTNLLNWAIEG